MSNRIFVDGRYLWRFPDKDEYYAIFSSKGNEEILEEYVSKNKIGNVVVGKAFMSAYWMKPIRREGSQEIIGTSVFYVNCCNFGGSVP